MTRLIESFAISAALDIAAGVAADFADARPRF